MQVDLTDIPWWIVVLGLELPVVLALVDCWNRPGEHFEGGVEGQRGWRRWMVVAVLTAPLLVGFLLVIAYYNSVVRRQSPTGR